ncbi:EF hand family protein [Tritrichomonas foetus]|uniref:EF hand family protein n=1 Tax=Tritrichomonas foetus TaxID=1144522 RepID=A0A1J4L4N9_9EUKA|nr:EF hand family protein [Tritrichomonas foetus]|eukprot:OHT16894.1 EF hand family protein [Tritrichomonas foetus]
MSAKTIIANAKKQAIAFGVLDIVTMSKMFNEVDEHHHGYLNLEDDIEILFHMMGIKLRPRELKVIAKVLDPDDEEKLRLAHYIEFFIKDLPENRKAAVLEAFKALSPDGSKKITRDQLEDRLGNGEFTIIGGRKVLLKQLIEDIAEMLDMDHDGVIYEADFVNYYRDLSDKFESDELFNKIVKSSWSFE